MRRVRKDAFFPRHTQKIGDKRFSPPARAWVHDGRSVLGSVSIILESVDYFLNFFTFPSCILNALVI